MGIVDKLIDRVASRVVESLPSVKTNLNDRTLFELYPDVFKSNKKLQLPDAYKTIAILYACVRARAKNIAQCPLKLYTYKNDKEIKDGYWYNLFEDPNNFENYRTFIEGTVSYLNLNGNWYWEKVGIMRVNGLLAPTLLDLLPATRTKPHVTDNGEFIGYDYDNGRGGKPRFIPLENMIHCHTFNPYSRIEGLSPLQAAKMTLDTEWYAMRYNVRFFEGDARPNMVYTVPPVANKRDVEELRLRLKSEREGIEKQHTSQVLSGGVTVTPLALAQKDMEFLEQRKFTRDEICMITGVPKTELSLYEDVNYATALSQKKQFWDDQLIPEMKLIEETINHQMLYAFGLYCKFDTSGVPALAKGTKDKIDSFVALLSTLAVSRKEANELLDLGLPDREGDDDIREPFNPFADTGDDPEDEEEDPKDPEEPEEEKGMLPTAEMLDGMRGAKWASLYNGIVHIEAKAAAAVRKYFFDCGKKLLKHVKKSLDLTDEAITKARSYWKGEETPGGGPDNLVIRAFISPEDIENIFDDDKLKEAVEEYLKQAAIVGGEQIFHGFEFATPEMLRALGERLEKITLSNTTAKKKILKTIDDVLKQRIEEGLGEEQARKLLEDSLKDDVKALKSNARTIARTQTNGAYSDGRYMAAFVDSDNPPLGWQWLSSRDSKVRETHRDMDGQIVPVTASFVSPSGVTMKRPHDPAAPAREVVNCRCIAQPIYDPERMS